MTLAFGGVRVISSQPRVFLFGKLPAHGDFVVRGLEGAARDAWDERASRLLRTTQERLGDDFEGAYDSAPPWRFVCGPSSLGSAWRAGALAPSVDSAGRRFLLVLGVDALSPASAAEAGEHLAAGSESAIYEALSSGASADDVCKAAYPLVAGLPPRAEDEDAEPAAGASRWWTVDEAGAVAIEVSSTELPTDLLLRTLDATVEAAP